MLLLSWPLCKVYFNCAAAAVGLIGLGDDNIGRLVGTHDAFSRYLKARLIGKARLLFARAMCKKIEQMDKLCEF